MNKKLLLILGLLLILPSVLAQDIHKNIYQAGDIVRIEPLVNGDAVLAGANVTIEQGVSDDVLAAGGQILIRGPVRGDVRVAGGLIQIDNDVSGDVTAAGGDVRILGSTGGDARLAGGYLQVGDVNNDLYATGSAIIINGTIGGNAHLNAEDIEFGPNGKILGNLNYSSDLRVNDSKVLGTITYTAPKHSKPLENLSSTIFAFGSALLLGLILLWLLPARTASVADAIISQPWKVFLAGIAALVVVPIVAVLLLISIIGIPLAIALILVYVAVLFFGKVLLAFAAGRKIFGTNMFFAMLSGLVIYYLLRLIPFVGGVVAMAGALYGLGAVTLALWPKRAPKTGRKKRRR